MVCALSWVCDCFVREGDASTESSRLVRSSYPFLMSLSIVLDGSLTVQLTGEARPTPIPLTFNRTYTKKAMHTFAYTAGVTNQAVGQGAVTAPKLVLIWVRLGTVSFSWANDGAAPTVIKASDTPPAAGEAPVMLLMRDDPAASQLYITTTGPVDGDVWVFS